MKKQGPLVIFVLVASSAVVAEQAPAAGSADAPVAAPATPSPSPSARPAMGPAERQEAMRRMRELPPADRHKAMRQERELRQAEHVPARAGVARDNNTQVEVVSVDTTAGTMTFNDVEGETNTWQFEPAAMAHDPLLKPGARVRIAWKSDAKTGLPIPTILGIVATPSPSPPPARGTRHRRPGNPTRPTPPSASPLPSPPASLPPR